MHNIIGILLLNRIILRFLMYYYAHTQHRSKLITKYSQLRKYPKFGNVLQTKWETIETHVHGNESERTNLRGRFLSRVKLVKIRCATETFAKNYWCRETFEEKETVPVKRRQISIETPVHLSSRNSCETLMCSEGENKVSKA